MNVEQATTYAQALIASVTINVIVPLLILALLMLFVWVLLRAAQRKADFHIEQVFMDPETNRVTVSRFTILMAFVLSSWYLATDAFGPRNEHVLFAYLAAWSNSLTLLTLAQRWNGVLPFAKVPGEPQ